MVEEDSDEVYAQSTVAVGKMEWWDLKMLKTREVRASLGYT